MIAVLQGDLWGRRPRRQHDPTPRGRRGERRGGGGGGGRRQLRIQNTAAAGGMKTSLVRRQNWRISLLLTLLCRKVWSTRGQWPYRSVVTRAAKMCLGNLLAHRLFAKFSNETN